MTPGILYQWVLAGPCVADSLRQLHDASLCRLFDWLVQEYDADNQTGETLGLCLVEQAARFSKLTMKGEPQP